MGSGIPMSWRELIKLDSNLTSQQNIITDAIPDKSNLAYVHKAAGERDVYYTYYHRKHYPTIGFGDPEYPRISEIIPGRIRTYDLTQMSGLFNNYNLTDIICVNKKGHFVACDLSNRGIVILFWHPDYATDVFKFSTFPDLIPSGHLEDVKIAVGNESRYLYLKYNKDLSLGLVKVEIVSGSADIILQHQTISPINVNNSGWYGISKIFYYQGYLYAWGRCDTSQVVGAQNIKCLFKFDANTLNYLGSVGDFDGSGMYFESSTGQAIDVVSYQGKLFVLSGDLTHPHNIHRFDIQTGNLEIIYPLTSKYRYYYCLGIFGISQ